MSSTVKPEVGKVIFDQAFLTYGEESARLLRLESKAGRMLTVLSFFLGIIGLIAKFDFRSTVPPEDELDCICIAITINLALYAAIAWFKLFSCYSVQSIARLPIEISAYKKNDLDKVHIARAHQIVKAVERNRKIGDEKATRLFQAFRLLEASAILISILVVVIFLKQWNSIP